MDELFIGSAICKITARGKLLLPVSFRRTARLRAGVPVLRLFVDRREGSDCLTIFDRHHLSPSFIEDGVSVSAPGSTAVERDVALRRRFGFATPIQMELNGEIILPAIVRARLKIRDKVLLVAIGDGFEIWDVQFVLEWGHADLLALVRLHQPASRINGDQHEPDLHHRRTPRRLALATQSGIPIQPLPAMPVRPGSICAGPASGAPGLG